MSAATGDAQQALILKFYDALINPSAWQDSLDEFGLACGAEAASLAVGESLYPMIDTRILGKKMYALFDDAEYYNEQFGESEVAAYGVVYQKPLQTWVTDEEAFGKPAEELPCARYQRERFGVFRRVAARLNDTPVWSDGVVLHFHKDRGNLTEAEAAISRPYLPHIAKVVELSRPFSLLRQRYDAVLGVLDMLRVGVVITSAKGQIVATNKRADDVMAAGAGLMRSAGGQMALPDPAQDSLLSRHILAAANAGETNASHAVMSVPRPDNGGHWILETFCLADTSGDLDGHFKGACTFIIDPYQADLVSADAMQHVFGLTAAESDICKRLSEGLRIEDIADSRNVSPGTVRTQIKSLFDKTNSRTQVDLVRQALRVNLPVERRTNDVAGG